MPTFPGLARARKSPQFMLQNPSRSGGIALNGQEQTVSSGAERWRATIPLFVTGRAALLEFHAFIASMLGQAGEVLVPTFSGRFANWPLETFNGELTGRVLHPGITRRKSLDGTIYEDPEVPSTSAITATAGAASLGATSIVITVSQGQAMQPGQLFGIGQRLYRALTVSGATVTFRPKLRVAVTSGTAVLLTRPLCLMKFASDDEGADLDHLFGGPVTLNFVEAF